MNHRLAALAGATLVSVTFVGACSSTDSNDNVPASTPTETSIVGSETTTASGDAVTPTASAPVEGGSDTSGG